MFLDADEM